MTSRRSGRSRDAALSKLLALVLRHRPELYGLELDDEGWTSLDLLVNALQRDGRWSGVTEVDVRRVVEEGSKQRYEVQGGRIRARYGHSLPGRVRAERADPPEALFHGTSPDTAALVLREGLRPMRRQYVHLSADMTTARSVGRRKSRSPALLRVAAGAAAAAGVAFYEAGPGMWLAEEVAPEYLSLADG